MTTTSLTAEQHAELEQRTFKPGDLWRDGDGDLWFVAMNDDKLYMYCATEGYGPPSAVAAMHGPLTRIYREGAAQEQADAWVVPKVPVDDNPHVRPRILANGLIRRDAGDSTPAHTLQYVGQLLAAVDEADARTKETSQ